MKKLLLIAILMLALVITAVACTETPDEPDTSADDVTTAETPTEAPTDEPDDTPEPEVTTPAEPEETTPAEPDVTTEPEVTTPAEPEVTTEPEPETTVDPDAPVHMIDPEFINEQAQSTAGATVNNNIGSSEVLTEGSYKFTRLTSNGGDPYVAVVNLGANLSLTQYMAISYRTNSAMDGQVFIGSGQGWTGQGDSFSVSWNEDAKWNLLIIDLAATGVTSITDNLINYARLDFFAGNGAEGDYIDVEYVAFFNTPEAAQKYASKLHNTPIQGEIPDTSMDITVNAADSFNADSAADAKEDLKNTGIATLFPNITYGAGEAQYVLNGEVPQFSVSSFTEAFVKMDGTYVYSMHSLSSATKRQASYFIRGAQSVKPLDTTGITNILNNYYETDGQAAGHAGAGIQFWNHSKLLIGIKYYDETALTKIGTAYWLITTNTKDADVKVIDNGSMIYVTVNGDLVATIALQGAGKVYEGMSVSNDATFCEKAIVNFYVDVSDAYGNVPTEDGSYVIENTLVVDTPASDVGLATRTGTLKFTQIGIAPLSSVEIPQIPGNTPTFEGNAAHFSICADNVRTWVGESVTDLCTQEAHLYMADVNGQINIDGLDAVSFRGWANPTIGGLEIDQFGYQIGMNEPVFSTDFWQDEPGLNTALNSPVAKRFENIKIPVAELEAGTYDVYLLVKDTNGVVYCMNSIWGPITLVKTA